MGWRAVEVEVILFYVFSMIAFVAGEPKDAFLEDGVFLVP